MVNNSLPSNQHCYVVTEKYFNDGSHSTSANLVCTTFDNISEGFSSDNECDTFVKPFHNYDEAFQYLNSRFYRDLVDSRTKNRISKIRPSSVW